MVQEIMDTLILDQFLQSLNKNIWVWVRLHQPVTLDAVVKLTEEFTEADLPMREEALQRLQRVLELGRKFGGDTAAKGMEREKEEPRGALAGP